MPDTRNAESLRTEFSDATGPVCFAPGSTRTQVYRWLVLLVILAAPSFRPGLALGSGPNGDAHELEPLEIATVLDSLSAEMDEMISRGAFREGLSVATEHDSLMVGAGFGVSPPRVAGLNFLAYFLWKTADFAGAERAARESISLAEDLLEADHTDRIEAQNVLGFVLTDLNRLDEAYESYADALRRSRSRFGTVHAKVSAGYNNLAVVRNKQGRYFEGETLFRRALAIVEELYGPDDLEVAHGIHALAVNAHSRGDFVEAESLYRRALDVRSTQLGLQHPTVARNLQNLAKLLDGLGDFEEAEATIRRTLAIYREVYGDRHPNIAVALTVLADVHAHRGDLASAETLYRECLAIREQALGPGHTLTGESLLALGAHLTRQGRAREGLPLVEEALAIQRAVHGTRHPSIALTLHELGMIQSRMGDLGLAIESTREALEMQEAVLGVTHHDFVRSLALLARLLREAGEFEEAEWVGTRVLELRMARYGVDHTALAGSYMELGQLAYIRGDREDAEKRLLQAVDLLHRLVGDAHPHSVYALWRLGNFYIETGRYAWAEQALLRAARSFESARYRAGSGLSAVGFVSSPYHSLAVTQLHLGKASEAWVSIERSRGRLLSDQLAFRGGLSPDELAEQDRLRRELVRLEGRLAVAMGELRESGVDDLVSESRSSPEELERIRDQTRIDLRRAEAEWSRLQHQLGQRHPDIRGRSMPLEAIQRALADNEAILGWVESVRTGADSGGEDFHSGTWGYVIRHQGEVQWAALPAGALETGGSAGVLRDQLFAAGDWPFRVMDCARVDRAGQAVWRERIEGLEPFLDGVERCVVIPSGSMNGVPGSAILDAAGQYLDERFSFVYAPSASVFCRLRIARTNRAGGRRALVVGDPRFGVDGPAPLPASSDEVGKVARFFADRVVLSGSDASESGLNTLSDSGALSEFQNLHFATHAFVDGERPERSALALASVSPETQLASLRSGAPILDGYLTAREILSGWELSADLVVLSGCRTATGLPIQGEGYLGLARTFLQVGAGNLLVSLWPVGDEVTSILMERIYQNSSRLGPADALHEAARWLRELERDGERPYRHPAYWSAFVLLGRGI